MEFQVTIFVLAQTREGIDDEKVKQKVEAAAKAAGFHITYVKSMDDR